MLGNRVGYALRLAVFERVITAHDALQFRELTHHAGGQIGFAEPGRFHRVAPIRAVDIAGNRRHQRFHTPYLAGQAAELFVEDQILKRRDESP